MPWEWKTLAAAVRLLFLLAPFMGVAKEFSLTGVSLAEAREMAAAGSCRALLVSFPVQLFLAILARASNTPCQKVNWLMVALFVIVGSVATVVLYNIPARIFRGTLPPYICFVLVTAADILTDKFALTLAISLICPHSAQTPP
jgi:hypothetical protein